MNYASKTTIQCYCLVVNKDMWSLKAGRQYAKKLLQEHFCIIVDLLLVATCLKSHFSDGFREVLVSRYTCVESIMIELHDL